ncbi:putative aldouronate transport system permease protein [Paenibacillus sp. UNCCL117]|uniref:ABC transporter permease n=1 Tax=unclassified Paenibacillus TaxID=185978 RepID=UPI0008904F3A|nr:MULTISPECIES: ABC transporter permease subunit [unclassified Paenibacillus]SDC09249.1 putative aldouronate transport system permease protein [Paenibacillus sp. cl123]SFW38414.1 putative aldouronate transport system permease protein [Paenibacillus sp. UNCCL117]
MSLIAKAGKSSAADRETFGRRVRNDFRMNRTIYAMLLPVVLYFALFYYGPLYGLQIAFKDYSPVAGIWGSEWVGFQHFQDFFNSFYFLRLLKNTLLLSFYELIIAFPAGILLALLLNEIRMERFKKTVQTITYLPHFISVVVVVGFMVDFLARDGLINQLLAGFGIEPIAFLREPGWFRTLFIGSGVWQNVGWSSIVFLAAISNIDPSLYEAAKVDGAGRLRQMLSITIPGMAPTVIIMFILQIGTLMAVGSEKILLMYNPVTYETADVIGTYVYRKGILEASFSYSSAVGLFNAVINFTLLVFANSLSKRVSETKLW